VINEVYSGLKTNREESILTFQRVIDSPGFGTIQKGEAAFALAILCCDDHHTCWAEEQLRSPLLSQSEIWRIYEEVKKKVSDSLTEESFEP
jgi:hypothetical protein